MIRYPRTRCVTCDRPPVDLLFCKVCGRAFDKRGGDDTIASVIAWTSARLRAFHERRKRRRLKREAYDARHPRRSAPSPGCTCTPHWGPALGDYCPKHGPIL